MSGKWKLSGQQRPRKDRVLISFQLTFFVLITNSGKSRYLYLFQRPPPFYYGDLVTSKGESSGSWQKL